MTKQKDFRSHPVWITGAIDYDLRTLCNALEILHDKIYIPFINAPRLPPPKNGQRQSELNYQKAFSHYETAKLSADKDDYIDAVHYLASANRFLGMAEAHHDIEQDKFAAAQKGGQAANKTYSKYSETIKDFYIDNIIGNGGQDLFVGENDLNQAAEYMHEKNIVPLAFTTIREHLKGL